MSIVAQIWHFVLRLPRISPLGTRVPHGMEARGRYIADQMLRTPAGKPLLRRRREELAREREAIASDTRGLVEEIRRAGYRINSLHDLMYQQGLGAAGLVKRRFRRRFVGPYRSAYPILARHLFVPHEPLSKRCIASALARRDIGREIEAEMLRALSLETDECVRLGLATSLWCAMGPARAATHAEVDSIVSDPRRHDKVHQVLLASGGGPAGGMARPMLAPLGPISPDGTRLRVTLATDVMSTSPVEVTPLGEGLFRLERDVVLLTHEFKETEQTSVILWRGDIFVAEWANPTTLSYVSVHGANRHFEFMLPLPFAESSECQSLLARVEAEGGRSQLRMSGLVRITMPETSTFDPTSAFDQAIAEHQRAQKSS